MDLRCLNEGTTPTFERRGATSIIDLTFATERLIRQGVTWKVLQDETLSDHHAISVEVGDTVLAPRTLTARLDYRDIRRIRHNVVRGLDGLSRDGTDPTIFSKCLADAVARSRRPRNNTNRGRPVYWWEEVYEHWRICQRKRRTLQREERARRRAVCEDLWEVYKLARKRLRLEIKKLQA